MTKLLTDCGVKYGAGAGYCKVSHANWVFQGACYRFWKYSFELHGCGHHNTPMYNTLLHRPRTSDRFASLMELYEQNYVLMRLLVPELRALQGDRFVSTAPGAMPLELNDISHSRYTSTFTLTYRFSGAETNHRGREEREPDLAIRLYHDARSCEVMSGLMPEGRVEVRRTRDLDEGRRLNRFLNKWLSYCLRQGHCFTKDTQVDDRQAQEDYCTQC